MWRWRTADARSGARGWRALSSWHPANDAAGRLAKEPQASCGKRDSCKLERARPPIRARTFALAGNGSRDEGGGCWSGFLCGLLQGAEHLVRHPGFRTRRRLPLYRCRGRSLWPRNGRARAHGERPQHTTPWRRASPKCGGPAYPVRRAARCAWPNHFASPLRQPFVSRRSFKLSESPSCTSFAIPRECPWAGTRSTTRLSLGLTSQTCKPCNSFPQLCLPLVNVVAPNARLRLRTPTADPPLPAEPLR